MKMNAVRRQSTADTTVTSASATSVHRQSDRGTRYAAIEAARRQRQFESRVLSQIYTRAQRLRERARAEGKTPLGRPLDEEEAGVAQWGDANPITLIELIQASTAVFQKHAITPPNDAMFHRHLLTLSMDPEPDWKRKIQRFLLSQKPRVTRQSLSVAKTPVSRTSGSSQTRTITSAAMSASTQRRSSITSRASIRTPQKSQKASVETQRRASIVSAARPASSRAGQDLFGDTLSTSLPWKLKENQMRNAVVARVSDLQTTMTRRRSARSASSVGSVSAFDADEGQADMTLEMTARTDDDDDDVNERADNDQDDALEESIPSPSVSFPSPQEPWRVVHPVSSISSIEPSPVPRPRPRPPRSTLPTSTFQCMATVFQQWKEITKFQRLVHDNRQRELRLTQSILPPAATFAIFKWIAITLPAKPDLESTQVTRAIPASVSSRGIMLLDPKVTLRFTGRLLVWLILRIFHVWKHEARKTRAFRIKGVIRRRTQQLQMVHECLHQWWSYTRYRHHVKHHGTWVEALKNRHRLRDTMRSWRAAYATQQRINAARQSLQWRVAGRAFRAWWLRTQRRTQSRVLGNTRNKQWALRAWRRAVRQLKLKRESAGRAVRFRRRHVLARSWLAWRNRCRSHRWMRAAVAGMTFRRDARSKRKVFMMWKAQDAMSHQHDAKCDRFSKRRRKRVLQSVVDAWAMYTRSQRHWALLLLDRSADRESRLVQRAFRGWITHFTTVTDTDEQRVHYWETRCRHEIWHQWKAQSKVASVCRLLLAMTNAGLMKQVVTQWKHRVDRRCYQRVLVLKNLLERDDRVKRRVLDALIVNWQQGKLRHSSVSSFMRRQDGMRLQVYLWEWHEAAKMKRAQHQEDSSMIQRWWQQRLDAFWSQWRHAFYIKQCVRLADTTSARSALRLRFHRWKTAARQRQDLRRRQEAFTRFRMQAGLRKWNYQVEKTKHVDRLRVETSSLASTYLLARGWRAWRQCYSTGVQQNTRIAKAVLVWKHRHAAQCFRQWVEVYRERKRHRRILEAWMHNGRGKVVMRCWAAWRGYIKHRHHREQRYVMAQCHYEQTRIRSSLRTWKACFWLYQARLSVLQRCLDQWTHTRRLQMFQRWRCYVNQQRKAKQLASRMMGTQLRSCFLRWRGWLGTHQATASRTLELTTHLQNYRRRRAIRRLHLHAALSKRLHTIQALMKLAGTRGLLAACFRGWVGALASIRAARTKESNAARLLQHYRQQRCIQQWHSFARVKKLLTHTMLRAQARSTVGLLAHVFKNWRAYTTQQKLFNSLKEKASVFRVFCLLPAAFRAWNRYAQTQQYRRLLITKTARLMSHRREARAFKAWVDATARFKNAKSALRMWQNQAMLKAFIRWKAFRQYQRYVYQANAYYRNATRRKVLGEWHKEARRQGLLRHVSMLWNTQTTKRCFQQWTHHVKIKKRTRTMLQRLRNGTVARVFNSWKLLVQGQVDRATRIQQRFMLLWNHDRKMTCFLRWQAFRSQQRTLKTHVLKQLFRKTSHCFTQWKAWLAYRKTTRQYGQRLQAQHARRAVEKTWIVWRSEATTLVAVAALYRQAMQHSMAGAVKLVFLEWRRVVNTARRVKQLRKQLDLRTVAPIVTKWREYFVLRRRQEKARFVQVQQAQEWWLMRQVLRRMRGRVLLKRACVRVLLPQIHADLVAHGWNRWLLYHARKQSAKQRAHNLRQRLVDGSNEAAYDAMKRWRLLDAARAFEQWTDVISTRTWVRSQTIEALHLWQATHSRKAFDEWRHWTHRHTHQRRVESSARRHIRARAWRRWLAFHTQQQHQRFLKDKADTYHQRFMRSAVFAAWRSEVSRQKHFHLIEAAVAVRRLHRVVREWHRVASVKRASRLQLTLATVTYHHKTMRDCWQQWTDFVVQVRLRRRELQQNTERLQVLTMCSVFRAWYAWSRHQRKITSILSALTGRCNSKMARGVLVSWSTYVKMKHFHRVASSQLREKRLLARGLVTLRENALCNRRHHRVVAKARAWMELLQSKHLAGRWRQWKTYTIYQRKSRLARARYNTSSLLPTVWKAWRFHLVTSQAKRKQLARAVGCWRSQTAGRAWNALALYRQHQRSKRHAVATAETHYLKRLIRTVLHKWHVIAGRVRKLRVTGGHLLVRWRMQTAYKCFANWQQFSLQRKSYRVASLIVSTRQATDCMNLAWQEWRRLFVVAHVGQRRRLRRSWLRLGAYMHKRQRWRAFQQQQQRVLVETVRVRHRIKQWRQFVVHAKLSKTMALLSSRFSKDTLARRCFERWLAFLVLQCKEKEKMRRALQWIKNRSLLRCFHGLQTYTDGQRRKRAQLAAATVHYRQRTLRSTFTEWKTSSAVAQRHRQTLRRYLEMMHQVCQRKSFTAWREFATRRRQVRTTFASIIAQRTHLTTHAVFQSWLAFVENARRKKGASDHYVLKLCRTYWTQWQRFLILAKMERMLGASAQRLQETCFVEWRKRATISKTARELGQVVAARQNREWLRESFVAWCAWSRLQCKYSKLLISVAIGHHLRFRFTLWRRFTVQRSKLRRLTTVQHLASVPTVLDEPAVPVLDADSAEGSSVQPASPPPLPPAVQLARISRRLHRLHVNWWDQRVTWQRWRHAFHACLFYRIRRLHQCFAMWQAWSRRRHHKKALVQAQRRRRRVEVMRRVLGAWCGVVVLVKQIQRERRRERELLVIVSTEIQRQERKMLQRHWTAWHTLVEVKRYLLVSVKTYWRARVLTKFWLLWAHDYVKVAKQEKERACKQSDAMAAFRARRAVRKWRAMAEARTSLRDRFHSLKHARLHRLARCSIGVWRQQVGVRKRARELNEAGRRRRLQWTMTGWRQWVAKRRLQQERLDVFIHRQHRRSHIEALIKWLAYVKHRRRVSAMKDKAVVFHLHSYLHKRWRRELKTATALRQTQLVATTRLTSWKQRQSLRRWHAEARSLRLLRLYRRFVYRRYFGMLRVANQQGTAMRYRALRLKQWIRRVLLAWKEETKQRGKLRQILLDVVASRQARQCERVWSAWLGLVHSQRKKSLASQHYEQVVRLKWLLHWYDAATLAVRVRSSQLAKAVAFHAFCVKRRGLLMWIDATKYGYQRRALVVSCMLKLRLLHQQCIATSFLDAWRAVAEKSVAARQFARDCTARRALRVLMAWTAWVYHRKQQREAQRSANAYRRDRLLSAVFFHWQNYALAWKDAEAVTKPSREPCPAVPLPRTSPPPPPPPLQESPVDPHDLDFRRPLSPQAKRYREKKQRLLADHVALDDDLAPPPPSLPDAAVLSLDVKKRLLVLGKWKPSQRSLGG